MGPRAIISIATLIPIEQYFNQLLRTQAHRTQTLQVITLGA